MFEIDYLKTFFFFTYKTSLLNKISSGVKKKRIQKRLKSDKDPFFKSKQSSCRYIYLVNNSNTVEYYENAGINVV